MSVCLNEGMDMNGKMNMYIYKVNKRHVRVINGVGFNTALEMLCDMRSLPNQ